MNSIKNWGGLPCSCTKIVVVKKFAALLNIKWNHILTNFLKHQQWIKF